MISYRSQFHFGLWDFLHFKKLLINGLILLYDNFFPELKTCSVKSRKTQNIKGKIVHCSEILSLRKNTRYSRQSKPSSCHIDSSIYKSDKNNWIRWKKTSVCDFNNTKIGPFPFRNSKTIRIWMLVKKILHDFFRTKSLVAVIFGNNLHVRFGIVSRDNDTRKTSPKKEVKNLWIAS